MKSRSCYFLLWTVALLAVVSPLQADVPQMINYQGVLTSGGNPVTTPVEVVFSIWNDETAGDSLWSEQQTVTPDADGVFSVLLGSISPIQDSVFAGTSTYLSIKIGFDPEITPRTRIVSSGYAYRVGTVDGASGGTITDSLIVTDGGDDTTNVQPQRIVIRGAGGDVTAEYSSHSVIISSAGAPVIEIGLDGIFVFGESRAGDTTIKIGSDGIVQVTGGVMFSDSTIQMTQAGASNGLPEPGGTMTGPIASVGNPYITMGKGNFGSGNTNAGDYSFVAGLNNTASGYASSVSGGQDNTASQTYCAIGGGVFNAAAGNRSTVGGGVMDSAFGRYSGVSAGLLNRAGDEETDTSAYVGGGSLNAALGKYSSVLGGISNTANGSYSTIAGGINNYAGGIRSSVSGGSENMAVAPGASVGGGYHNYARGTYSVVGGGGGATLADSNSASGDWSSIGGGKRNLATQLYSTISGGSAGTASSFYTVVSGGYQNDASNFASTVGGGNANTASGDRSTVAGGADNTASGFGSTVGGGWNGSAAGYYSTVAGGGGNSAADTASTVSGGWDNEVFSKYGTIGGGENNSIAFDALHSVICGGLNNLDTNGNYNAIGGGQSNTASGIGCTISGGNNNSAHGDYNSIGGGQSNFTSAAYATIAGGYGNYVEAYAASVLGGQSHIVQGLNSVVIGGASDTVGSSGTFSMLFGTGVYINNSYRVAFFNSAHPGKLGINRDDNDSLGINYPIHVGTSTSNGNGAYLSNGGVWTQGTGKASRGDVWPLNKQNILGRIDNIPIDNWSCKGTGERHIGPAAEDFHAQFDVGVPTEEGGRDTEHLAAYDMAGVALVGVQELYRMVREQQQLACELQQKNRKIEELELRLTQMEAMVETILANQNGDSSGKLASNR